MADAQLPAPINKLVAVINLTVDSLLMGLGVEATIAAVYVQAPWINVPIVRSAFRFMVEKLATSIDLWIEKRIDNIVIRYQNDSRKNDYDKQIEIIKRPGASPDEIAQAKIDIDRLVSRAR